MHVLYNIMMFHVFVCKRYNWLLLTTHLQLLQESSRAANAVAVAAVVDRPSVRSSLCPGRTSTSFRPPTVALARKGRLRRRYRRGYRRGCRLGPSRIRVGRRRMSPGRRRKYRRGIRRGPRLGPSRIRVGRLLMFRGRC